MPYPTLPDRAIPYHMDGTVIKAISLSSGTMKNYSASEMEELNDQDYTDVEASRGDVNDERTVIFFPHKMDIYGLFGLAYCYDNWSEPIDVEWSDDTTNGVDGTWQNVTAPSGFNGKTHNFDSWREDVADIEALGCTALRIHWEDNHTGVLDYKLRILHLYGQKTAGEEPDDIIFLDPDNADAEFPTPMVHGDIPAGTSNILQFKIKNTSSSLTASNIDLVVNDPEDIVRISDSSGGPWNVSMNLSSLGPGATSAVYYVKAEAPAPPTALEPKRAPIEVTVGAWS